MRKRMKLITGSIFGCLAALALTVGVFGMKAEGQGDKHTKVSIPAEQAIESIKTAIAAKPGNVRGMEVENEDGKVICEVRVLAQDNKTYEIEVDVAANAVVEVEEDDEDEDNEGDRD